ncbi:DNA-directed RNA polymerase subunit omega [Pelagibacteraceae bacterium]|nr:DNA-directed RNA polymerase subunit omega [Pelagibacteraceae bacterium]
MARITVEDCMTKIDNQYDLVLLAKERTAQLNAGVEMLVPEDNDKKTIISLREIGEGKVQVEDLAKSAILRLRKEPDENLQQEETEEEENDEFESLYKGQISKSGIAILPSKRTRKIPDIKKIETAEPQVEATETQVESTADNIDESLDQEPLTLKEEVEVKE